MEACDIKNHGTYESQLNFYPDSHKTTKEPFGLIP